MILGWFIALTVLCIFKDCHAGAIPEALPALSLEPKIVDCPNVEGEGYTVLGMKMEDGDKKVLSIGESKLNYNDPSFDVIRINGTYSFVLRPSINGIEVFRCDIVSSTGEILKSRDFIVSPDGVISKDNEETKNPPLPSPPQPDKVENKGIVSQIGHTYPPENTPNIASTGYPQVIPESKRISTVPDAPRISESTNYEYIENPNTPKLPLITDITESQLVSPGDMAILSCSFINADMNDLSWLKKSHGKEMLIARGLSLNTSEPGVSVRLDSTNSVYSLVLSRVQPQDSGTYRCQINSAGYRVISVESEIRVIPSPTQMPQIPNVRPPEVPVPSTWGDGITPEIIYISPMQSIKSGQMAILECSVRNGEDYAISWSRETSSKKYEHVSVEDTILIDNDRFSITYDAPRTTYILAIRDVRKEDSGSYKCIIQKTHDDFVEKEVTLEVDGQNAPATSEIPPPAPTQATTTEKCCDGDSSFTDQFSAKLSERIMNRVIPKIRGIEENHRQMQMAVNQLKSDYRNLRSQLTTMKKREQKPEDVPTE